jgi:hypothetical protein
MLSMPTPCLRRHPTLSLRCVDIAGHGGAHMAEDSRGTTYSWTDEDMELEGLRELAQREARSYPEYYGGSSNPYEAIKVIEAWDLNFNLGNVVKYIARAGKKDKDTLVGDLEKALDYLNFEIERRLRERA